jgi:hypothetical protein
MSFLSFCIFILSIIIAIIPILFNVGDIQSKISIGNLLKGKIPENIENHNKDFNNIENDNLSNELRKKYKILLSDIINYQNDISYLVSERKLLEKINELKIETEKFQEIENKYKTPKIITNFTDKEINEIKGLINDYLK